MIENEKSLTKKAQNYFKLAEIGESLGMTSESATNYFKSLSAINDLVLLRKDLIPKNHFERFNLLKKNDFKLYEITDKLFNIYREAYFSEISEEDLNRLKNKVKETFKHAGINIASHK